MADSVDGLVIEIESSASSVAGQLDILTNRLSALKTAVSGSTPIKTFSKNYQELVRVINTTQIDTVQLEAFRAFGQVLNSLNAVKVSGTVSKNITSLNTAVNGLNLEGLANVTQYTSTLSQLSDIKISPTLTKRLNELAEFGAKIQGQNFSSLQQFTSALAQLGTLANVDASAIKALSTQTKNFGNTARSASTRGRTFNTVLANIRVRTLALVRATQMITRVVTKSLTVYGDYIETLNLFKQAMGDAAGEAYEFGEKAQNLLGIDLTQWMKAQGVLNSLAVGFGVSSDRAAIMSKNLTQLAYDISSFYNIDVDTAIEKVRSGFSGQIRPVRDLGYDLSQAKLEAIALSMGIDKSVKSMTQGEKSQLRYIALITQLTHVQGDLARTLDSPINQMRILQAQLNQMYREIGLTLLPILNKILPYLNAILRVIKMIASEIAAMFGYVLPSLSGSADWSASVSMGAEDLEEDLEDANGAAEKLKNTLASFDQINLISSKSGGSGSGGGTSEISGSGFDFDLPTYDFLGDAAENKAKEIADKMMKALRPFIDMLKDAIKWTVDNIDEIKQALEILAVVTIGKKLYGAVQSAITWFNGLSDVAKTLGFITIGLQLSWLGGKDIAQGETLKGLIKSTLGSIALGYGMSFALGPVGWVLGITTGVIMTFEGYRAEKVEQLRKKINEEFMQFFPDQKTITELSDSWKNFIDQFYNPEVDEKNSTASTLKTTVDQIGTAIVELQAQYNAGTVTGIAYATNLEIMYADMEEAVKEHLKAVGEAIDAYLDGPFGRWLQAHGKSVQDVKDNVQEALEEIGLGLEENRMKLQELNHSFETGKISEDEYVEKSNEIIQALSDQYEVLGLNTEATTDFMKQFNNINFNFEDWDTLHSKLDEIKSGYEDAEASIDKNTESLKGYFQTLKDNAKTDEMKAYWQGLIDETKAFGEEQKKVLNKNYRDILESIETSGSVHWARVYNEDGLVDTHDALYKEMKELDNQLNEMYGGAGMSRNETYWKSLMGLMDDFEENAANGIGSLDGYVDDWEDKFGKWSDQYKMYLLEQKEASNTLTSEQKDMLAQLRKQYAETSNVFGDYVNDASYYAQLYDGSCKAMEEDTVKVARKIQFKLDETGNIIGVVTDDMVDDFAYSTNAIGNIIGSDSWSVDPMDITMNDVVNIIGKKNGNFTNAFWGLMNSATRVLGDPTGMMQRSLFNALDVPEQKMVGLGFDMGVAITDGIESTAPEFKSAAHTCVKGMADEFNIFGEEVYKYFGDLFNAGTGVLTVMGISSGQNNVNIKKPKIKGYATGGFPDTADFFYANENGVPEYVGSMGGRTAVATNNDIVKGVSDGVYRAIKETGIQSDVRRIASKDSKVVFAPSEEAGRFVQQSVNLYNGAGGRY